MYVHVEALADPANVGSEDASVFTWNHFEDLSNEGEIRICVTWKSCRIHSMWRENACVCTWQRLMILLMWGARTHVCLRGSVRGSLQCKWGVRVCVCGSVGGSSRFLGGGRKCVHVEAFADPSDVCGKTHVCAHENIRGSSRCWGRRTHMCICG